MFENVIVGVDGKDGGRDAIALAGVLRAREGRLTLVHIKPGRAEAAPEPAVENTPLPIDGSLDLLAAERDHAHLEAELRSHDARSVGRGLHESAQALGADLLVIGSSRRGRLGRVFIGDDTRDSLNGAPCAVAIAPAGYRATPPVLKRITVGYNASPEAAHALSFARKLAVAHGARLAAFEAVYIERHLYYGPAPAYLPPIEELVEDARERLAALEGVEPHAAYGEPSAELARYSSSTDLLVIGSRDHGPLGRLVYGSTAQRLCRTAHCPLLILTRAARSSDAAHQPDLERHRAANASQS